MPRLLLMAAGYLALIGFGESERNIPKNVNDLEESVKLLSRHLMSLQHYRRFISRTGGESGVTTVHPAFAVYYQDVWKEHPDADVPPPIHSHPDRKGVLGLADLGVVMNGVHFRTGHVDYPLRRRARSTKEYWYYRDIEMPPVPPQVTRLKNVDDQIAEMRQWFKAWRDQNPHPRDYRKYFKPVFCYLEGWWAQHSEESLKRKFRSKSMKTVIEQLRFMGYTELASWMKDSLLPVSVLGPGPLLGRWEYKVLCKPLSKDLPLKLFHLVDDVEKRLKLGGLSLADYKHANAALFTLAHRKPNNNNHWDPLDEIMKQVPGLDGTHGYLNEKLFGRSTMRYHTRGKVNTAYYHRWYSTKDGIAHRSFSDSRLFVARNTDPDVVNMKVEYCRAGRKSCKRFSMKTSYAIPLEIVYLTPLQSWDPYGLSTDRAVTWVRGRMYYRGANGTLTGNNRLLVQAALNGANETTFYTTPSHFFVEPSHGGGPADTGHSPVFVVDGGGLLRRVVASGVRAVLPEIPGVGRLRTRFPIMPFHEDGDPAWMELAALADVIMAPKRHFRMRGHNATEALCPYVERSTPTTAAEKENATTVARGMTPTSTNATIGPTIVANQTGGPEMNGTTTTTTTTTNGNVGSTQLVTPKPTLTAAATPTTTIPETKKTTPEVTSAGATSREVTSAGATSTKVKPAGATSTKVKPAGATSTKVTPAGATSTEMTPAGATSTEMTPTGATSIEMTPTGATSTKVTPAGATGAKVSPAVATSIEMTPAGTTSTKKPTSEKPTTTGSTTSLFGKKPPPRSPRPPAGAKPAPTAAPYWMKPHYHMHTLLVAPGKPVLLTPPPPRPGVRPSLTPARPIVLVLATDRSPPSADDDDHRFVVLGGGRLSDLLGGKLVDLVNKLENGHQQAMTVRKQGSRVVVEKCHSGADCERGKNVPRPPNNS